jgi:copper chaperone
MVLYHHLAKREKGRCEQRGLGRKRNGVHMTEKSYKVPDVDCGHCKAAIEKALGAMGGIDKVAVDVATKTLDVSFDENAVSEDAILATLAEEGYPVAS